MRKSIFVLLVLTLFTGSAHAQGAQYVGPSNGTAQGDEGILGFNALCQATCEGCQFCTSGDILQSGSPPASPGPNQWVAPTYIGISVSTAAFAVLDITGVNSAFFGISNGLSCGGWITASNTFLGLFMNPKGGFSAITCNNDYPAACCKLMDEDKKRK